MSCTVALKSALSLLSRESEKRDTERKYPIIYLTVAPYCRVRSVCDGCNLSYFATKTRHIAKISNDRFYRGLYFSLRRRQLILCYTTTSVEWWASRLGRKRCGIDTRNGNFFASSAYIYSCSLSRLTK